uniref:Thioesterase domain-containing protein n=1 Tax=Panagrolaimus sp. ES5 TaxID=591445 RepID=A0AC34GWW5_9BILA
MLKRFCSNYAKTVQKFVTGTPEWKETFMKYPSRCKVIEAEPGQRIKYEFTVTKDVLNTIGTLHGGCLATVLDVCMGNLVYDGKGISQQPGVSVDLSVSYMNAVKLGETIVIEANTLKHGKILAFLEAKVYRKSDNLIVAVGKQTLAIIPKEK